MIKTDYIANINKCEIMDCELAFRIFVQISALPCELEGFRNAIIFKIL